MEINTTDALHQLFDSLPRLTWLNLRDIPFENGIYVCYEKGQKYGEKDRIVRVGTHLGEDKLISRLREHFVKKDKNKSVFRKHIGRVFLAAEQPEYLPIWDKNMTLAENRYAFQQHVIPELELDLENRITEYLRQNISFVCFQVETKKERVSLEKAIIGTLAADESFHSDEEWLGMKSPIEWVKNHGLWNQISEESKPLNNFAWIRLEELVKGKSQQKLNNQLTLILNPKNQMDENRGKLIQKAIANKSTPEKRPALRIKKYMDSKISEAIKNNEKVIDFLASDIHKAVGLNGTIPLVCEIMHKRQKPGDIELSVPGSTQSGNLKIRYRL